MIFGGGKVGGYISLDWGSGDVICLIACLLPRASESDSETSGFVVIPAPTN